jgi:hypothetical protein
MLVCGGAKASGVRAIAAACRICLKKRGLVSEPDFSVKVRVAVRIHAVGYIQIFVLKKAVYEVVCCLAQQC